MLGRAEIKNRFGFHKGTDETIPFHAETRREFRRLGEWLDATLPDGRAKSVAFTELESAAMWAHKSISEAAKVVDE